MPLKKLKIEEENSFLSKASRVASTTKGIKEGLIVWTYLEEVALASL